MRNVLVGSPLYTIGRESGKLQELPMKFRMTRHLTAWRCLRMLKHMRTTINLPDDLVLQAKKAALEADTTLTEIIANALRETLARRRQKAPKKKFKIITYGKGGTYPGVDISDTSSLLDIMDGIDDPNRQAATFLANDFER